MYVSLSAHVEWIMFTCISKKIGYLAYIFRAFQYSTFMLFLPTPFRHVSLWIATNVNMTENTQTR